MSFDRTKLKKVKLSDLEFGKTVYENNQGITTYQVDKTFNVDTTTTSIPLIVISDTNGYFKKNTLVYRHINNLLIF